MKENTQREVLQIMKWMYQKTPEKGVQVFHILDRNFRI